MNALEEQLNSLAVKLFLQRRRTAPKRVNNAAQYAGAPMIYYCDHCGHISDIKPEEFVAPVRKVCGECDLLVAHGLLTAAQLLARHPELLTADADAQWVLRHYDGFDNEWCDITQPLEATEAIRQYLEKTLKGTKWVGFNEIDYYRLFPADTKMVYSAHEDK
jgi:hypothetical protein